MKPEGEHLAQAPNPPGQTPDAAAREPKTEVSPTAGTGAGVAPMEDPPVQVNQTPFIQKLYSMLEDANLKEVIEWSDSEDSFFINPGEQFSQMLCLYFKHTNIASFVRQLSMYGFHKVSQHNQSHQNWRRALSPKFSWEFRHVDGAFKRNDFAAVRGIKRRSSRRSNRERKVERHILLPADAQINTSESSSDMSHQAHLPSQPPSQPHLLGGVPNMAPHAVQLPSIHVPHVSQASQVPQLPMHVAPAPSHMPLGNLAMATHTQQQQPHAYQQQQPQQQQHHYRHSQQQHHDLQQHQHQHPHPHQHQHSPMPMQHSMPVIAAHTQSTRLPEAEKQIAQAQEQIMDQSRGNAPQSLPSEQPTQVSLQHQHHPIVASAPTTAMPAASQVPQQHQLPRSISLTHSHAPHQAHSLLNWLSEPHKYMAFPEMSASRQTLEQQQRQVEHDQKRRLDMEEQQRDLQKDHQQHREQQQQHQPASASPTEGSAPQGSSAAMHLPIQGVSNSELVNRILVKQRQLEGEIGGVQQYIGQLGQSASELGLLVQLLTSPFSGNGGVSGPSAPSVSSAMTSSRMAGYDQTGPHNYEHKSRPSLSTAAPLTSYIPHKRPAGSVLPQSRESDQGSSGTNDSYSNGASSNGDSNNDADSNCDSNEDKDKESYKGAKRRKAYDDPELDSNESLSSGSVKDTSSRNSAEEWQNESANDTDANSLASRTSDSATAAASGALSGDGEAEGDGSSSGSSSGSTTAVSSGEPSVLQKSSKTPPAASRPQGQADSASSTPKSNGSERVHLHTLLN